MTMSRRNQSILLAALLAVLALVVYFNWSRPSSLPSTTAAADEKYKPISIENPALRSDLLKRTRELVYTGRHRDIFSASAPPPPTPPRVEPVLIGPQPPPPPPAIVIPAKFFGYVTDVQSGRRRAFFSSGEDVFILAEGETLQTRFRLVRIGNSSADFEEVPSGRRATITLEEPGPTA